MQKKVLTFLPKTASKFSNIAIENMLELGSQTINYSQKKNKSFASSAV